MFDFNSLILDRTEADVARGTAKGFYNATDLNRVEGAVLELNNILFDAGYPIGVQAKTDWLRTSLPTEEQMIRYLANIQLLQRRFYKGKSVVLPSSMQWLGIIGANDIEKIVKELEEVRQGMVANYVYCGTFDCGGEIV